MRAWPFFVSPGSSVQSSTPDNLQGDKPPVARRDRLNTSLLVEQHLPLCTENPDLTAETVRRR